ncbi:MAG: TlyA family RNA methyltransferase [Lewinella sp.]|nr:TlyA family RNA methyltransferase [Lewinella sp.]
MRLDQHLVQHGFFDTRERAQRAIRAGAVRVDEQVITKPAFRLMDEAQVIVEDTDQLRYVSQGGHKLARAITAFGLDFTGKTVLDIGASTGGFTDCALQHGAARVYAVDVGTGQLHPKLRDDARVVNLEQQDLRTLTLEQIGGQPADLIVADVSFISLTQIFPYVAPFLQRDGWGVVLIKPQFELDGRRFKGGIVREEKWRQAAIERVRASLREYGFVLRDIVPTQADGKQKNIEYLAWWSWPPADNP